jgi:hypothetical protein
MALPILDGNQSATTLSSILTSGEHIPAHTVVSLGTQAITDITSAVSGTSVCVGSISISGTPSVTGSVSVLNFPASQSTTFGAVTGSVSVLNFPASQSVTFGATTGSISVLNFPVSQAVTFSAVSISNLPSTQTIAGTVTANVFGLDAVNQENKAVPVCEPVDLSTQGVIIPVGIQSGTVTANLSSSNLNTVTIGVRGSVTVGNTTQITDSVVGGFNNIFGNNDTFKVDIRTPDGSVLDGEASVPVQGTVDIGSLPAISGTVTANIGNSSAASAGFVKICGEVAGGAPSDPKEIITDSQGMLYARIAPSNSLTSDPVKYDPVLGDAYINVRQYTGTSVTIGSALPAGTAQIGSVTASISNSVTIGSLPAISGTVTANTFALQGTAVTTSDFTSTTASTVLANYNATRQVLTIFNEGAGNLHICAGATCTTIAYQVRLSAGDYYEAPSHQTTITHSAVFVTAGTARVTEVS